MRKIASLVAEELKGQILQEQSITTQLFESIKDGFARLSDKLHSFDHNQSSMQLHLIQEMSYLSTRLFKIEAKNKEELLSIKKRLEESIKKLEVHFSGDPKILELIASLNQLIFKYDSARVVYVSSWI